MHGYRPDQLARHYRLLGLEGEVSQASPHRLIQLLFEHLLVRLALAQTGFEHRQIAMRSEAISRAIAILDALRDSLAMEQGDLAHQLDSLYEYCSRRLLDATQRQDPAPLSEVSALVQTLKSAWDGIAPGAKD
ncbi:MAG TPA: flagellar export chaperone FliS [Cellvibrionaceae bacterium]